MRDRVRGVLRKEAFVMGFAAVALGTLYRFIMSFVIFLQADEEIFAYDAYYFILGESFDFIVQKIGAYLGYPFLLSLWYRAFGVSLLSARMFSVFCSAFFLMFVYLILRRLTSNPRSAMLGTLLLALLPFPLRYGHIVLTEPLTWAVLSFGLYLLIRGMREDGWKLVMLSGMVCAVAFFIRRSALILPLVIFPSLLWTNRHRFGRMVRESFSWLGGFMIPFVGGILFFILIFGWDRLEELRWTRIPNITPEWTIDLQNVSSFENALFTIQPTIWKGTFLMMLVLIGGVVILMSLFRDRWKAIYAASFLWPAFMRLAFDSHLGGQSLARIMVLPVVVLFIDGTYKKDHRFYLALSLFIGSTVGFSSVFLSGDIWNVIIYVSAAGIVLVYLADRLESRPLSLVLLAGGLISLYIITFKEPQMADLVRHSLPVTAMVYGLSMVLSRESPGELPLATLGLFVPLLFLAPSLPLWLVIVAAAVVILGLAPMFGGWEKGKWSRIRFVYPVISLAAVLFMPENLPDWGVYLPLLGMSLFMVSYFLRSSLLGRINKLVPLTGALVAFTLAFYSTRSFEISLLASLLVGSTSTIMTQLERISAIWKERVGDGVSVLLFMLVVGYLAFYVYYAWTEIYMTEFLFQAVIIGGLLLWTMKGFHPKVRTERMEAGYRRRISFLGIRKSSTAMFLVFLVLTIPLSVGFYMEDEWFREEGMDKRPYMRTIREIASWVEDNSDRDEAVLVWHCYAVEADRETIIEVSNAKVYNGYKVVADMEEQNISVFVRDWYTDHGIWRDQPVFQEYILRNFVIDRVIDGNECWLRAE
ncbi:MAG: ArnT family glycosyltransferase [Thermoplasmatota archaeon]